MMPQILVRDLDADTLKRLKAQAKSHGRSLQSEVRSILESATKFRMAEARRVAREWQKRLKGRQWTDSVELIREDRKR